MSARVVTTRGCETLGCVANSYVLPIKHLETTNRLAVKLKVMIICWYRISEAHMCFCFSVSIC